MHIVEIPTNKGADSYKLKISKIGNMPTFMTLKHYDAQLTNYGEPVGTCAILLDWWYCYLLDAIYKFMMLSSIEIIEHVSKSTNIHC